MNLNDAIIKRIDEICKERGSNICDIALNGGMSPSAIYDLIKGRTKCSKVITIKRFCEGAGITLSEFFDKDYFNDPVED
ncbi:MAG: helix-turn-helix transcriptional regulator [Clostridia bacterium]|nr:helix-turn-helix transcriptional regulator [Clostridia bacterium]